MTGNIEHPFGDTPLPGGISHTDLIGDIAFPPFGDFPFPGLFRVIETGP